jgi:hypothetical protein
MLSKISVSTSAFLLISSFAAAQETMCDNGLTAPAQHPFAYTYRGNRCEGIYIQEVSNALLSIVSFTKYFEDYDPESSEDLTVSWSAPLGTTFALRAQGIAPTLYYRMDTHFKDSTRFTWSKNILAALNIRKKDIGVTCWTKLTFDGREIIVLLPLIIKQSNAKGTPDYQLIVVPGTELKEVYVTLSNVDATGKTVSYLMDGEPLSYGYYPAGSGFSVPLSQIKKSGIYSLELGTKLRTGESASTEIYFYYTIE